MTLTQVCSNCGAKLPLSQFNWRNKEKGIRHTTCKRCHSEYRRQHYLENQEKYKAKARRWNKKHKTVRQNTLRKYIFDYFLEHPCVDCGETDPIVLEFDHVRGEKKANISYLIQAVNSLETLIEEIEKCDVRCANCHRRRTAIEQNAWVVQFVEEYNS